MDLEQETEPEEQPPMDVVLREIRQMLLADVQAVTDSSGSVCFTTVETNAPDYFLLTPGMRYDSVSKLADSALSRSVHEKAQQVLNKLSRLQETPCSDKGKDCPETATVPTLAGEGALESALTEWLNTRLPEMLERIVAQELQKALKK